MQRGTEGRGKRKEVRDGGIQGGGDERKGEMKKERRRKKRNKKKTRNDGKMDVPAGGA